MKTAYKVCSFLILALGVLHISLTPLFFGNLNQGALWFVSGGLVIIFVSFFNFILMSAAGRERLVRILCYAVNILSLVFASLMLIVESRRASPGPSTWFVLGMLVFETIAGFRYGSASLK